MLDSCRVLGPKCYDVCVISNSLAKDEIIANYIIREIYINVRRHGVVVEMCLFNSALYFFSFFFNPSCET